MKYKKAVIHSQKRIALVAHDHKKGELMQWAEVHKKEISRHKLYGTGTTGRMLESVLGVKINKLQSGPLGGDQQIGAMISESKIDFVIFFWDPLAAQPHDPDVRALLRLAVVWNIPLACSPASADFMISSPLMKKEYKRMVPDYKDYRQRAIET